MEGLYRGQIMGWIALMTAQLYWNRKKTDPDPKVKQGTVDCSFERLCCQVLLLREFESDKIQLKNATETEHEKVSRREHVSK